jgi:hypothetical protein
LKIFIQGIEGGAKGRSFTFEEHDTLILGRDTDCGIRISDDPALSRHHFILEVNPPQARLRDLGSLNGTYVNGKRVGGRDPRETPEEGARRTYPEVDLKDGDRIRAGRSWLEVKIERGTLDVPGIDKTTLKRTLACSACGREVIPEIDPGTVNEFFCENCRTGSRFDPLALVGAMVRKAGKADPQDIGLPGYVIERKIGSGAFGAVYLARHRETSETVAVKMILAQVAVSAQSRDLFLREMDVQKALSHPNIVRLREHGSRGGAFYFIMDYCDGGDVSRLMALKGGKIPFEEATSIIREALDGLSHAHSRGFVHRDIKPSNLLLRTEGDRRRTLISDFGLAKNFQKAGLSGLTVTGALGGTPDFMPREQITNFRDATPASDVFSVAATYYAMLSGTVPRERQPGQDPVRAVLQQPVVPVERRVPDLRPKVADAVNRALRPAAKDRFPTAAEFKSALEESIRP